MTRANNTTPEFFSDGVFFPSLFPYSAEDLAAYAKATQRRQRKRPTLASVAKDARKAGIEIARYVIKPDGTVVVITGKSGQQHGNEVDQWIAKHAR